ncbi:RDD family protein [Cellulosimicrobium terreum]|nr:RDD family protein [Cellulosimicrobium terreum]
MTDVTCAACGSSQVSGAAFCAVCGQPFPRTGRPVAAAAQAPSGQVQRTAGGTGSGHGGGPGPDAVTEPEIYGVTQKAMVAPAPPSGATVADAPTAGVGRRFVAFAIDVLVPGVIVLAVLLGGLSLVGFPLFGGVRVVTPEEASALLTKAVVVYVVAGVIALAWWVGTWFWEGSTGKTLGNLAMGIRTLDATARTSVGFGRALLRWLIIGVSAIIPPLAIVVVLSPAFDSSGRRQGWHDGLAKAVVLDVRGISADRPDGAYGGVESLVGRPDLQGRAAPVIGPAPGLAQYSGASYPTDGFSQPAAGQRSPGGSVRSFAPPTSAPSPGPGVAPSAAPAPTPDPWAFPSPAPSGGSDSLITGVPGAAQPPQPPRPAPAPAPVAPEPSHAVQAAPARSALQPAPVSPVALELESGELRAVDGPTLIGRNPQAPDAGSWNLVAVDDPTRSVSKTHAELGVDGGGLWVTDRGSTNGTVVSAPGTPPRVVAPGTRVRVPVGGTVHVGDRRVVVRAVTR